MDEKLTEQDEVTSAADTDIIYIVVDTGGTPTSKKIQIGNLPSSGSGAFIPLSGTTGGNPVTGTIEVNDDFFDILKQENSDDGTRTNLITFQQDAGISISATHAEGTDMILQIGSTEVQLLVTNNSQKLDANMYLGDNASDLDFVQKKYVDETQRLQLGAAYSDEDVTDLTESTSVPVWSKYIGIAFTLTDWLFDVVTVPTGSAITLDVHKNGTTIFSTKPTIAAAANISTGAVISTATFAVGDFCEVFIDVVGTTTTGKGLKGDPIGTLI